MNVKQRIDIHNDFWEGSVLDAIPVSFRLGDYFFADKFSAAMDLLKPGLSIEPHMICVDDYMEDYERMYDEIQSIGQTGFWTAEPYVGIPWMEAIAGCSVWGGERSITSEPVGSEGICTEALNLSVNPWFHKYMEFVHKLHTLSKGRFPVGQSILRGIADLLGAVLGQSWMIYEMVDCPQRIEVLAETFTKLLLEVIQKQHAAVCPFEGGYALGFYHVWAPDKCLWFQDDLAALMSPDMYRNFLQPLNGSIASSCPYSMVHVHPVSFHRQVVETRDFSRERKQPVPAFYNT